ncbi:hypothetical protein P7K49_009067 [Saguinus oedipus]|uniref:Uncharacterized protein n=1 Tax=Saguinus oedipus TaxID=9490 RepID=A0ABQ9W092_SAGOE|nr:hypothetical protein P7K49_009067 [Saguinus oedipus]
MRSSLFSTGRGEAAAHVVLPYVASKGSQEVETAAASAQSQQQTEAGRVSEQLHTPGFSLPTSHDERLMRHFETTGEGEETGGTKPLRVRRPREQHRRRNRCCLRKVTFPRLPAHSLDRHRSYLDICQDLDSNSAVLPEMLKGAPIGILAWDSGEPQQEVAEEQNFLGAQGAENTDVIGEEGRIRNQIMQEGLSPWLPLLFPDCAPHPTPHPPIPQLIYGQGEELHHFGKYFVPEGALALMKPRGSGAAATLGIWGYVTDQSWDPRPSAMGL